MAIGRWRRKRSGSWPWTVREANGPQRCVAARGSGRPALRSGSSVVTMDARSRPSTSGGADWLYVQVRLRRNRPNTFALQRLRPKLYAHAPVEVQPALRSPSGPRYQPLGRSEQGFQPNPGGFVFFHKLPASPETLTKLARLLPRVRNETCRYRECRLGGSRRRVAVPGDGMAAKKGDESSGATVGNSLFRAIRNGSVTTTSAPSGVLFL